MAETHPAIKWLKMGRGYGVTDVPVVDFARLGGAKTLHVLNSDLKAICGTKGRPTQFFRESDPKAIVVSGQPVCVKCQDKLGHVPMPFLSKEGVSQ